jgi:hypothetical protein
MALNKGQQPHIYRTSNPLDFSTEPTEETPTRVEFILYYKSHELESEKIVDYLKTKSSLSSRFVFHDVTWISKNPSKYNSWFSRRGIKGVPSIYEKKTGKVYGDGSKINTALNFLEKLVNSNYPSSQSNINTYPSSQSNINTYPSPTAAAGIEELREMMMKKNIEDAAFQAKVLAFIEKSASTVNRTPALQSGGLNIPHEIPMASPKVTAFRSGSPPSSPPTDVKSRIKYECGPGKMMPPIHSLSNDDSKFTSNNLLTEEERKKREREKEKEIEKKDLERQQNIDEMGRYFDGDDSKIVFIDPPSSPRPPRNNNNMSQPFKKQVEEKTSKQIIRDKSGISW